MRSGTVRNLIVGLWLMCNSAIACAAEWWLVTPEGNYMTFADAHSIVDKGNGIRIAWTRADKLVGLRMLYHQFDRTEFNCADHSVKILQSRLLHPDPQFNKERQLPSSALFVHPGSEAWGVIDFVCQYAPDAARSGKLGTAVKLPANLSDVSEFVKDRRKKWIAKNGYEEEPPVRGRTVRK